MKRVLNIVSDDKFIDNLISLQDLTEENVTHDYVLIHPQKLTEFNYIKNTTRIEVLSEQDCLKVIKSGKYNAVTLHALYSAPLTLIPQIPHFIKVFWIAWGYDIYQRPHIWPAIRLPLYQTRTKRQLDHRCIFRRVVSKIRNYCTIHLNLSEEHCKYKKAVSRIDYFSGILPEEYYMMNKLPFFNANSFCFKYGLPVSCKSSELKMFNGHNILVGNSGNPTNNHLDIFEKIKTLSIGGRIIIVPLNYGGSQEYIDSVIRDGKCKFQTAFYPLLSFLRYTDYEDLVASCSIGIFFQERQQALGNITMMLLRGCKVFLSDTSVTYKHFKDRGINVFSIQKHLNQESIDQRLTADEIESNRKIILNDLSKEAYMIRLSEMVKMIN